jgi:hypothetical protein
LEQLADIVERVTADRVVQRAEIRRQGIRIKSCGIRRGKTSGIEKNVVTDILEVAEDSALPSVTVHRFSKTESNSSSSISRPSACSPFVTVVPVFACSRARSDR